MSLQDHLEEDSLAEVDWRKAVEGRCQQLRKVAADIENIVNWPFLKTLLNRLDIVDSKTCFQNFTINFARPHSNLELHIATIVILELLPLLLYILWSSMHPIML